MTEWLDMIGTYSQRNLDNYSCDKFIVDTSLVTDMPWTYETSVKHKDFNDDKWVVLDGVDNKEKAQEIHNKWVEIFKSDQVTELSDIINGCVYKRKEEK